MSPITPSPPSTPRTIHNGRRSSDSVVTSMKEMTCVAPADEGCLSSVSVTGGQAIWARTCCAKGTCLNEHTKPAGGSWDVVSCYKDNCNTMDPRNGSDLHHPALLMVSFSALLALWNI